MKKFIFSLILLLAASSLYASWIPSEKYANWVPTFQVDKTWKFENGSHNEGAGGSVHSGTSTVDFPGTIAWCFMSWDERCSDSDDHNMDWFELYLRNGNNDNDQIQIVGIYISSGDNDYWPRSVANYNGNKTSYAQARWYDHADGAWFCYMVTEYSPTTRQFIERAGNNLQIKVRTRWDDNSWNTYTKATTVNYSDRQFLPVPTAPSVNNVEWTVYDNQTALKYTRTIPSDCSFRLRSLYNQKEVFNNPQSTIHNPQSTEYTYPFLQSIHPTSAEMYQTVLTYECFSEKTYTMNQSYYNNSFAVAPKTSTLTSPKTTFAAPPFAQVQNLNAKDNNDGTISLTWSMKPCTESSYDNSPIIIERATDKNFTQDVKKEEEPYDASWTNYKKTVSFSERDLNDVTYFFRAYRKKATADNTALTATKSVCVNTNYAALQSMTGEVNDHHHPVLHCHLNSGVCTPQMQLQLDYAGKTKKIPLADVIKNGDIEITDELKTCEAISFSAQVMEGNTIHGQEQQLTLVIPNDMGGVIASYSVSKGFYNDRVQLQWHIDEEQYNFKYFQITRKELSTPTQAVILSTIDFKNSVLDYAFEDVHCVPGVYYEYQVVGYTSCNDVVEVVDARSSVGFAQPYGVVSGQITYSGNQGVPNVMVSVIGEDVRKNRSLRFLSKNNSQLIIPQNLLSLMMGEQGTVEYYMRDDNEGTPFMHVAILIDGDQYTVCLNGEPLLPYSPTPLLPSLQKQLTTLQQSGNLVFGGDSFDGFVDEIRVWNICRSVSEIRRTMNTYLNGSEFGLTGYYRCDDNVENELFDISKTGTTFNEHHLTLRGIVPDQDNIPTVEQLSLKTFTDANGHYLINNIPYTENGSLYNVIPTLGVHEFSPSSRPLFFNRDAATHNSIDFTDQSSFTVTGKVTYENTDYPVQGCQFSVDGQLCTQESNIIESDAEGRYTIQVPIGEHQITISKDGHTFVNNGRYPADPNGIGVKAMFDAPRTGLQFYDNTTVLVVGRVAGGSDEAQKTHGFGKGNANIGQARIVITPPEDIYNLNLSQTDSRIFECPDSLMCNSVASVKKVNGGDAHSVTIITDASSGEFAVALPPVDFEISEIQVINNPAIQFDLGQFENLTLGSSNIHETMSDTLWTDSVNYKTVTYLQKLDAIHFDQPQLSITQSNNRYGAFGEQTYYITLPSGQVDTIPLYSTESGKLVYTLDVPAFMQTKTYAWTISAFETYINYDYAEPQITYQPMRDAIVTIKNELGEKEVASEDGYTVGEKGDTSMVVAGQIISLDQNQVLLDSLGQANYLFTVGEPNIIEPYTYNVNITYETADHSRVYSWSENGKFKGLIFGARTSGTNFVTDGPDQLLFVLRDPPGGQSFATWSEGQSTTTTIVTSHEQNRGTDNTELLSIGFQEFLGTGVGIMKFTDITNENNIGSGQTYAGSSLWSNTSTIGLTTTQTISTKQEYPYVGTVGDVFIGSGTNRTFGNARKVDLERIQDNPRKYKVIVKDVIATGSVFTTSFNYTTWDIEENVIPNYIKERNALLQYVDPASYSMNYPNFTSKPIYITTLTPDDPRFGTDNSNRSVWGDKATPMDSLGGPSYMMIIPSSSPDSVQGYNDEVCHLNNQINRWKNILANNERSKVYVHHSSSKMNWDAWDQSCKEANKVRYYHDKLANPSLDPDERKELEEKVKKENIDTALYNALDYYSGGWLIENVSLGGGASVSSSRTRTIGSGTAFHEEDGCRVAVIKNTGLHVNSWGWSIENEIYAGYNHTYEDNTEDTEVSTIEYTLSVNDYEYMSIDVYGAADGFGPIFSTRGGQTYCPYEGEEKTKYFEPGQHELHTATVNMEQPQIRVDQPTITDVPIGGKAIYTLTLANLADINPNYYSWLKLYSAGDFNKFGAQLSVDGSILTDAGRLIKFYPSQPITKTLVLTQTDLGRLDYDSIAVILSSDCNLYEQADTVWLSAHFVPTCSEIGLQIDNTTINTSTGDTLSVIINGYDRNFRNFNNIRLQYRHVGDNDWHLIREFCANESDTVGGQKTLITGPTIYYSLVMPDTQFPDGEYEFRAVTACSFGNEEIPNESDIIIVTKDMQRPMSLGLPGPINGIYTPDNQIFVNMNEPIQTGRVRDKNISVKGVLNAQPVNDHAVALQLGETISAYSDADFNFSGTDFTIELWYNYSEPGVLFSHALGTNLGMIASVSDNHLGVYIGNYATRAQQSLPKDKWCFITFEYENDPDDENWGTLTAHYAVDDQEVLLLDHVRAPKYDLRGNLLIGGQNQCKMHDLALWNIHRDWRTSLSERNKRKDAYTNGLLSYWPMNEGEGLIVHDIIRGRHLQLNTESWWYNNNNIALAIPAGQVAKMNLSECSIPQGNDFVFECWFRMLEDGTLFSLSDSSLSVGFIGKKMQLALSDGAWEIPTPTTIADGSWHHLALNYRHNTLPIFMLDGQTLDVIGIRDMPRFASAYLVFSSEQSTAEVDIDEVRLWNAYLTPQNITLNRRNELKGDEAGLVAYYPIEQDTVDEAMQPVKLFSLKDRVSQHTLNSQPSTLNSLSPSSTQPALRKERPVEEVQHTYTPSERIIVINITEPAARIEGCTLELEVTDLVDEHGNYSSPIHWTAYVNRNQLLWDEEALKITKTALRDTTLEATIVNNSGLVENWSIENAPSWLYCSETSGILQPLQKKTIKMTVPGSLTIGNYEQTIYLIGNEAVPNPLRLSVRVNAEKPNWNINPADYEFSMNMIATASINNSVADDSEDLLAAFIDGQIAGLSSPQLVSAYNRHYIMMDIYTNLSVAQRDSINRGYPITKRITFKYWDASTGRIFTNVKTTLPSSQGTNEPFFFQNGQLVGSLETPVKLKAGASAEQQFAFEKGWNWISFNVLPENIRFDSILQNIIDNITIIKSQNEYAQVNLARQTLMGNLQVMNCLQGYKMQVSQPCEKIAVGSVINPLYYGINLKGNKQWTWMGYLPQMSLDVNTALANINPSRGDIIKARNGFATWDGYQWIGSLKVLSPGNAYLYFNTSNDDITLYYPSTTSTTHLSPAACHLSPAACHLSPVSSFTPISPSKYAGNMTLTAVVMNGDQVVNEAEVGIFAEDECRAAAFGQDGLWFLTIPGDKPEPLTIQVAIPQTPDTLNFKLSTLNSKLYYQEDAVIGTCTEPYVIQIGDDTALDEINSHTPDTLNSKHFHNGILYILHNGRYYTAQGTPLREKE